MKIKFKTNTYLLALHQHELVVPALRAVPVDDLRGEDKSKEKAKIFERYKQKKKIIASFSVVGLVWFGLVGVKSNKIEQQQQQKKKEHNRYNALLTANSLIIK